MCLIRVVCVAFIRFIYITSVTIQTALVERHVSCFMKFLLISFGMYAVVLFFFYFSLCVSMLVFLWKLGEKGAVAKNGGLSVNVSLSPVHTEPPHGLHSFTASSRQEGDFAHQEACTLFSVHVHVPCFSLHSLSVDSLNCFRHRSAITVHCYDYSSFLEN